MILRKRIGTYLGNQPEILVEEAIKFWQLSNVLYRLLFQVTIKLPFYVLLPTCEFRAHLFDLFELKMEFDDHLELLGTYEYGWQLGGNKEKHLI